LVVGSNPTRGAKLKQRLSSKIYPSIKAEKRFGATLGATNE
jgi:hypothetical protein